MILLPVQRKLLVRPSAERAPLKLLFPAVILLLALFLSSSVYAADEAKFTRPDVLVLVLGGLGANDLVSINYATVVPLPKAQADLDAIASMGGWQVKDAKGETKASGGPNPVNSTSISFAAKGLIGYTDGTFSIEPFVIGLKRFQFIEIDYLVPSGFQFRGLKDFDNRYVNIQMRPARNSYRYRIVVKDTGFEKLGLPLVQPNETKATQHQGMPLGLRLALGLGLGLLGAAAAYLVATYLGRRRLHDTSDRG